MKLDLATLGAVSILLSALMGGLLLFSWLQSRSITALAWWGAEYVLGGIGVGVLGLQRICQHPSPDAIALGNALVAVGLGAGYCGCRNFNGRTLRLGFGLSGGVLWLVAWPAIADSLPLRLCFMGTITATYLGLSGWELLKHAPQRLLSQRAAVFIYVTAAVFCGSRSLFASAPGAGMWSNILSSRWSVEMAVLVMMYIPTSAVLLLSMAKERLEFRAREASLLDPLTLIPNRRAFFQEAERIAGQARAASLSCLLFDLDRFKQINDTYGHQAGDRVLELFARILSEHLPDGTFGRVGGEEFAAFLPADHDAAEQLAESIRTALASRARLELDIRATVSIGCATDSGSTLQAMLSRADEALYRAKAEGRDRITIADSAVEALRRPVLRELGAPA